MKYINVMNLLCRPLIEMFIYNTDIVSEMPFQYVFIIDVGVLNSWKI